MAEDQPMMFDRARKQAEEYASNPNKISDLLEQAQRKAEKNRDRISAALTGLQSLSRLLKAWMHGRYSTVPWRTIVLSIAAILYFVNPFDFPPDFLPGVGFLDDASVLAFVLQSVRKDIDSFLEWERLNLKG